MIFQKMTHFWRFLDPRGAQKGQKRAKKGPKKGILGGHFRKFQFELAGQVGVTLPAIFVLNLINELFFAKMVIFTCNPY